LGWGSLEDAPTFSFSTLDNVQSGVSIDQLIEHGNLLVAVALCLAAGVLAFASPCVLPLVPGYVGYIGGFTQEADRPHRGRLLLGTSLFIAGFASVFVTLNWLAGGAAFLIKGEMGVVTRIAGVAVVILGLVFIGQFSFFQRTIRPRFVARTGLVGAPLLGIIFGLGWTPCIGPTLAAVLSITLDGGSPTRGVVLGLAFSLGLGIPFLLVAGGLSWATATTRWLRTHIRVVNIVGGAMLITIGLLMATGLWQVLVSWTGSVLNAGFVPAI
jgi:cytochrome c-type biogenesis protein